MIGTNDGGIIDTILTDQAEDAASRDHDRRVKGEDVEPTETPNPEMLGEFVGSDSEGYLWVTAWLDMPPGSPDHIDVQVWDVGLKRGGCKSIDADTARTLGRYLFEAAHNLDLRAKEREEETK